MEYNFFSEFGYFLQKKETEKKAFRLKSMFFSSFSGGYLA